MIQSGRDPGWRGRPALGTEELHKGWVPGDSLGEAGGEGWSWGALLSGRTVLPKGVSGALGLGVQDSSWGAGL